MDIGGTIERPPRTQGAVTAESRNIDEALLLVQEGMLKMLRFQLALVRQDRRVAMQAIDGVISLERQLDDYVRSSCAAQARSAASQAMIAEDRAALLREKFTLAAGHPREVRPAAEPSDAPGPVESAAEPEPAIEPNLSECPDQRPSRVPKLLCGLAAVAVVAAALGGTLLDGGSLDVWGAFAPLEEALR